jgi:hypothetical protein
MTAPAVRQCGRPSRGVVVAPPLPRPPRQRGRTRTARRSMPSIAPPATAPISKASPTGSAPAPTDACPRLPHDATGHTWHHGDGFLMDYTRRGGQAVLDDLGVRYDSAMPAFGDILTDDEIEAILDYIKASWPDEIRAFQAERTEAEDD